MVIQAIGLLDDLDKVCPLSMFVLFPCAAAATCEYFPKKVAHDSMVCQEINTYSMRIKEWYGWHFPEMSRIVGDNTMYAKVQPCLAQT